MEPILKTLLKGIEHEEQQAVIQRVERMKGELRYYCEEKPDDIALAIKHGWTLKKLELVFCLNSFYQRIVAPLWASAQNPPQIGSRIPIRYGKKFLFDERRNAVVNKMGLRFVTMCSNYQVSRTMLEAQRTSDLIWILTKAVDSYDEEK